MLSISPIFRLFKGSLFSSLFILLLSFLLATPASSQAQSVNIIKSACAKTTPKIDGILTQGEWADSKEVKTTLNLISLEGKTGESHPFSFFLKNSANFLYIAGRLEEEEADGKVDAADFTTLVTDSFSILFDNNNNAKVDSGEDKKSLYILNSQQMVVDAHHLSNAEKEQGENEENEPQNITGSIRHTTNNSLGSYVFEVKIPLSSPDRHDIQTTPGATLRWNITYFDKFSPSLKGTLIGGLYGTDLENTSDWGIIQLAANSEDFCPIPTKAKTQTGRKSIKIVAQILNEKDLSASNLRFIGQQFDLVLTMYPFKHVSDALRRENPNISILLFNNPYFAFGEKFWATSDSPKKVTPNWILLDDSKQFIPYGGPTYKGMDINQNNIPLMDIRNKEWQQYFASQTRKHIIAGDLDGVFIDTMSEEIPPFALTKDKRFPAGYTASEWKQANYDLLNEIKTQLQGTGAVLYYNGISNPPGLVGGAQNKGFMDIADGTAIEAFSIYLSIDSSEMAKRWYLEKSILQDMQAVTDLNKGLVVEVYGETDNLEHRIFALSSFLLLQNENTYFYYTVRNEAGALKWRPEWYTDLGKPLGKYVRNNDILMREFENGQVYVNAGSSTVQIPLKQTYKNLQGNLINKLTLQPLTGSLVVKQ